MGKNQIVRQLADCEDETDALLRELQDWRKQHDQTFEKIKIGHNHNPIPPSENNIRQIQPKAPPKTENVDILRVHDRPHSNILAPPKTPENGDHEHSSTSPSANRKNHATTSIQKARMRQFQRRAAQHQRENRSRRDNNNTSRDSSRSAGSSRPGTSNSGKNSNNTSRTSTPGTQIESIERSLLASNISNKKNSQKIVINK